MTRVIADWSSLPLCCKYLVLTVGVGTTEITAEEDSFSFYWALGTLDDGQSELLGWWASTRSEPVTWPTIRAELSTRGLEHFHLLDADGESPVAMPRPGGCCFTPFDALSESGLDRSSWSAKRQRRISEAKARSRRVQVSLSRALRRRGAFPNVDTAAAFVDSQLERLDRRLWGASDACRRT